MKKVNNIYHYPSVHCKTQRKLEAANVQERDSYASTGRLSLRDPVDMLSTATITKQERNYSSETIESYGFYKGC